MCLNAPSHMPPVYAATLYCNRVRGWTVRQVSLRLGAPACIMAERRTCIPNNEDNDKSTRRIRPRMCAEYPMHNIASLSAGHRELSCTRGPPTPTSVRGSCRAAFTSCGECVKLHPTGIRDPSRMRQRRSRGVDRD